MKIIGISNFDLETVNDILVAENVPPFYAKLLVDILNKKLCSKHATYFYKAVENNYKLKVFEP